MCVCYSIVLLLILASSSCFLLLGESTCLFGCLFVATDLTRASRQTKWRARTSERTSEPTNDRCSPSAQPPSDSPMTLILLPLLLHCCVSIFAFALELRAAAAAARSQNVSCRGPTINFYLLGEEKRSREKTPLSSKVDSSRAEE